MTFSAVSIPNMVTLTFHDGAGNIQKQIKRHNITCDVGRESIAAQLIDWTHADDKLGKPQFVAVGTGGSTPNIANTSLDAEVDRQPVNQVDTFRTGTALTIYSEFPPALAATISELGLFVDSTATSTQNSGSLLARSVLATPETKVAGQFLRIEWVVNIVNC